MNNDDENASKWVSAARDWIEGDPDPAAAKQLQQIVDSGDASALAACFLPALEFGTAGLRGIVGPGPARMNLSTIRSVTRALACVVEARVGARGGQERPSRAPIVVGFDGRNDSRRFAQEAVGVLAETSLPVTFFTRPVPTPVVAFAARRLSAPAAIVVTASHNPPEYNGYKVYGDQAIQIVPPFDTEVTEALKATGPSKLIPCRREAFESGTSNATPIGESMADAYVDAVLAARVSGIRAAGIRIAYTPLHGVGAAWVERVLRQGGYTDVHIELSQSRIDGNFPTVRFPNPEEPATLELGLRLAADVDADVLLVNDPDADRLGAAIRSDKQGYRILSGNELGIILTDFVLSHAADAQRSVVSTTLVSTPMANRIAQSYGARCERTLTGFKWLWTAMRDLVGSDEEHFGLCWEEALGYSTHAAVRDKDGIAAAITFADWVSECKSLDKTPIMRLSELYRRHGAWASAQRSLTRPSADGLREIGDMMQRLRSAPPKQLAGRRVVAITDYDRGAHVRPRWCGASNLVEVEVEGGARIVVRPSGTEPKLKCYADVEEPVRASEEPLAAYDRAKAMADALNDALLERLERVSTERA